MQTRNFATSSWRHRPAKGRLQARSTASGRTVRDLCRTAEEFRRQREQKEAQRAAAAKARREAEAAAARLHRHLDSLRGKEPTLWRRVHEAVATRQPNQYKAAVELFDGPARTLPLRARRPGSTHCACGNFGSCTPGSATSSRCLMKSD